MNSYVESPRIIPADVPVPPLVWIGVVVSRIARAALAASRRRKAIRDLRGLDDRMLADIGLQRHDIEPAVNFGRQRLSARMPGS